MNIPWHVVIPPLVVHLIAAFATTSLRIVRVGGFQEQRSQSYTSERRLSPREYERRLDGFVHGHTWTLVGLGLVAGLGLSLSEQSFAGVRAESVAELSGNIVFAILVFVVIFFYQVDQMCRVGRSLWCGSQIPRRIRLVNMLRVKMVNTLGLFMFAMAIIVVWLERPTLF